VALLRVSRSGSPSSSSSASSDRSARSASPIAAAAKARGGASTGAAADDGAAPSGAALPPPPARARRDADERSAGRSERFERKPARREAPAAEDADYVRGSGDAKGEAPNGKAPRDAPRSAGKEGNENVARNDNQDVLKGWGLS